MDELERLLAEAKKEEEDALDMGVVWLAEMWRQEYLKLLSMAKNAMYRTPQKREE